MGLSESDKAKHPYYQEMQKEEEKKRWEAFLKSPEHIKIVETFGHAVEDYLYDAIKGDLDARKLEKNAERVIMATSYFADRFIENLVREKFYLASKMLERFDLVKEK